MEVPKCALISIPYSGKFGRCKFSFKKP